MRPLAARSSVHSCASLGSGSLSRPKFDDSAWAMITRPAAVDRDPIAVQRHLDPAVGAEAGVGLPRDVGQQARGEAQPAHRGGVVEQGRDPIVEQVAVLAEAMLAAAGLARRLDQRVEAPDARLELRIEQALANAEGRHDESRRLELVARERRAASRRPARSRGAPEPRPSTTWARAVATIRRSSRTRSGCDAIFVGDRQRVIGREHVDPRQRAPRPADHVEAAAPGPLAQARFLERRLAAASRALALAAGDLRVEPQARPAARKCRATPGPCRRRPARGCRRRDRRRSRRPRGSPKARLRRQAALRARRSAPRSRSRCGRPRGRIRRRPRHRGSRRSRARCARLTFIWSISSRNRRSAASALSRASGESVPRCSRPAPRPASTFSLKIGVGTRGEPGIDDQPDRVRPDVDDRRRVRHCSCLRVYRPRWKRSLGTLRPFFSAWPRPDKRRVRHEIFVQVELVPGLGWSRV